MKIQDLFATTSPAPTTKTAEEAPTQESPSLLQSAVQATLAAAASEQTKLAAQQAAAKATPASDLEKLAAELMDASAAKNIKLAQAMGRAFGDGLLERIAQHEQMAEKIAAANASPEISRDEEAALYNQFTNEWTQALHTKTAEHYLHGQELISQLLSQGA